MKAWIAFFKKEWLEYARSGKLILLVILFFAFGVMNPAVAKLTPWLMELMAEELAESGMHLTEVEVDALTSWTQFLKNMPMALIAMVLICHGIFARECESGTLILLLTKGLSRGTVVLAKAALLFLLWTGGYWLCFGVTYGYNDFYWDNAIAGGLMPTALYWWLFGVFVMALIVLFSALTTSGGGVLLGVGGVVLVSYLLGMIPKVATYLPTALTGSMELLTGASEAGELTVAAVIAAVLSVAGVVSALLIWNKKQL